MKNKIFLIFYILILILPISCGEGGGCSRFFKSSKGGVPVTVEKVRVVESSPVVSVSGKLAASDRSDISYPKETRVQDVYVQVGSSVTEGDPLFKMSEEEINTSLAVARARRAELELLLEKNRDLLRGREGLLEEGKVDQDEISRLEKEIAINEAEMERIGAEIEGLSYKLDHSVVNSPISGIVLKRNITSGAVVSPGDILISIVNVTPIISSFALEAIQAEELSVGTPLKIFVNEMPGRSFDGKVSYISPELHRTGKTFEVWVAIPNEDMSLKVGMNSSTDFESDSPKRTYIVPISSVLSKKAKPYVYIANKGIARKTPIVIGSIKEKQVEVVRGLEPGDLVVVKGNQDLFDGAEVNIWR